MDYAYNSDHGSNVFLAAYALQGGSQLSRFGFSPAQASRGNNTATVRLIYGYNSAPSSVTTDQIRGDLYVGGSSAFYSRTFSYNKRWGTSPLGVNTPVPSPATPVPTSAPSAQFNSGDNVIRCGPESFFSGCYANGEYGDSGDDVAWHGADGDLGTKWSSWEHEHSYWQASFQEPVTIAEVAIWERGGGDTMAGRLEFSDGSAVDIGSLNADGSRPSVCFAPRATTMVRFQVTGMGNRNTTGFREIPAADGYPSPPGGCYWRGDSHWSQRKN